MAGKKPFFIRPQGLIIFIGIIVVLAIITIDVFFKSPKPIAKEQPSKSNTTLFLEHLMIREGGLYTLVGTKPMTEFDIEWSNDLTEEDVQKSYEELKAFLEQAEVEKDLPDEERRAYNPNNVTLPSYEEYKNEWERQKEMLGAKELWDLWKHSHKKIDPKFCIFSRKAPYGEGHMGLFVNIPSLVYTLHHYRKDFCERTDMEFDPNEVATQIEDETSIFWEKVFQDHFLFGLVFGYGERSSYLFDWEKKLFKRLYKRDMFVSSQEERKFIDLMSKKDVEVSDLLWPVFFHFGVADPMRIYYELEREKIIEYFQDKDFTKTTLEILTGHQE